MTTLAEATPPRLWWTGLVPEEWTHHRQVPRERGDNLRWREAIYTAAQRDRHLQAALWEWCKTDWSFWCNTFLWLFNPRRAEVLPWITWPVQDEAAAEVIAAVEDGRDLLVEKSREMGATWLVAAVFLWYCTFFNHQAFLILSYKADAVDRSDDPDTVFWKLRFAQQRLPSWMCPVPWVDNYMHLGNPATESVIDGRATTGDAGRAGRRRAVLMDEHASMDQAAEVEMATADVTSSRIRVSTPKGMNVFGRLRFSGRVRVVSMHWTRHPEKVVAAYTTGTDGRPILLDDYRGPVVTQRIVDGEPEKRQYEYPDAYPFILDGKVRSPWYDAEDVRRGSDIEMAQEVDIDYLRSGHAWFDAAVVQRHIAEHAKPPVHEGTLSYTLMPDDRIRVNAFAEAKGGPLKLWCSLELGRPPQSELYVVACDIAEGTGASNSVASIFAVTAGRKVGELVTPNETPEQFALHVMALCRWLGGAGWPFLVWEMAGPGLIFGKTIVRLHYPYIYTARHEEDVHPRRSGTRRVPGWAPTVPNKILAFGQYRRALGQGRYINPSKRALEECFQYVMDERGSPLHEKLVEDSTTGARAAHGDRVTADVLTELGRNEQPKFKMPERTAPAGSYMAARAEYLAQKARDADDGW